jgi:hypothetical protein
LLIISALALSPLPARAEVRTGGDVVISAESGGSGGGTVTGGVCTINAAVGGVGGLVASAATQEVLKVGYPAQLYSVTGVVLSASPVTVDEGAIRQVHAAAVMDDETVLKLAGVDVAWAVVTGPVVSVVAGSATADTVYRDELAQIGGTHLATTGTIELTVVDTDPDNFGSYAADGIWDDWQVFYFGMTNPLAAPGEDPDSDTQSNIYEWVVGTVPTNTASCLVLGISDVDGVSTQMDIVFDPAFTTRTYQVEMIYALPTGSWSNLQNFVETTNGTERTVRHLNAVAAQLFYRVRIQYSP